MSAPNETPMVLCSRLKLELPAITTRITFAGDFGERIKKEVSQRAWNEWLDMQMKVINEYRLHLGEAAHRQFLQDTASKFFGFDGGTGELDAGPEGGLKLGR